jgi:hypothetical protein
MRRLVAMLPVLSLSVVACEPQFPTASQGEIQLAAYSGADIVLKGIEYSAIAPSDMAGEECQWMVDGDAMVTFWSRPDCQAVMGVPMWIEYTARLTPGIWRFGINAINFGALGDDPVWYPEFWVRSSLNLDVIRIPASDVEVHAGYTEVEVSSEGDFTVRYWWVNDKSDFVGDPPRDANLKIVSVFFDKTGGAGSRPLHWTITDLPCPEGTEPVAGQLQSAQPLDPVSGLLLVGTSTVCRGTEEPYWTPDWHIYDVSSGVAEFVDAFDTEGVGFNVGAHSPIGSSVVFGVDATALTIYDNGFRKVTLPEGLWGMDVWAASPASLWIAGSTEAWNPSIPWTTGGPGKIAWTDGAEFVIEHDGGSPVLAIWGFGRSAMFASTMTGILQRNPDGTWFDVELPDACGGVYVMHSLSGRSPWDVWAARSTCLLHFDGSAWSTVSLPTYADGTPIWASSVLSLSARSILVAGQGPVGLEYVALWGSVDLGQTWMQVGDPAFTDLPGGSSRGFFAMGATQGANRIFLPTIAGRKLLIGTPMDFAAIGERRDNRQAVGMGQVRHEVVRD